MRYRLSEVIPAGRDHEIRTATNKTCGEFW